MSESSLRWKGRLSKLKPIAGFVLLFAVIFLAIALGDLSVAANNPTEPQPVEIRDLVQGAIDTRKYVTLSGTALYPAAYQKTEDSRVTDEYFFVIDETSLNMILVEAAGSVPTEEKSEPVTISGLTRSAESKLSGLVQSDLADIRDAGLETTPVLYINEGEKPVSLVAQTTLVTVLGIVSLLCVATFFFPATVFGPKPIELSAAPAGGDPGVKATGQFLRLANVQPSIQIGKGTRKFSDAVANIVTLEGRRLMIYIHHLLTTRTYGVTVSRTETDWGMFIDPASVQDIEPGKLYGWRDRWAVRVRYTDDKQKPQTLFVSFNHAAAQTAFVNLLRRTGFMVGSGEASMM